MSKNKVIDYEAVLLAISYIETIINGDDDQHKVISETVDETSLIHGLSALSIIFLENTKNRFGVSREQLMEAARMVAFQCLTEEDEK